MNIFIKRYDPDQEKTWTQIYEMDTGGHSMTVMDVLQKISNEQDPSLAYFRHSICNHGICARCAMQVNGKVCLACVERVEEGRDLEIGPVPNMEVVRDLVTVPKKQEK